MRSLILAFFGCVASLSAYCQATGDYRSAVVTGNWNTNTTWETFNGTSWVGATFAPAVGDGVITVRSGHTITMTSGELIDEVVVAGILKINANVNLAFSSVNADVLTINSTGSVELVGLNSLITLAATARIRSSGILIARQGSSISGATAANCFFEAGSTYQHLFTSAAGTIPLATWNAAATLLIQGNVATGTAPANLNQSFGNVTYNVSNASPTLLLAGALTNIQGTFSTLSTHARPIIFASSVGYNLTVNGDFSLAGSGATTFNAATSGTSTLTIAGSYHQNLGTFTVAQVASSVNILVGKNFTRTNGSIVKSGSGTGTLTFNQTLPQFLPQVFTVTGAGTPFSAINFVAASGTTLDMGSSAVTGTGTFTLNNNATLVVGSTDASGAISTSGGNIRVVGTKTYSSGSTIRYHNATNSPQFMAIDHPSGAGITTVIDNSGGVTLVAGIYTLNGSLVLTNGNFNISGRDLTLGGTLTPGANFLAGDVTTILQISDAGTTSDFNNLRVLGTSVIGSLILNGTTGRTVRLGADITVANDLRLETGDLQTNGFALEMGGSINQLGGSLTVDASSSLIISDLSPSPLPADFVIGGGTLGTFTMNRLASELVTSSNLTVSTLNLVTGTLTHTGTIEMAANGKINVASGSLTNPVIAATVYDVEYNGTVEADTGLELPVAGTILRHLIVSNPSQVNLKAPGAVVNGDLILTAGTFFADTTDITLRGNFQSDGISDFISGTTFFDGTTVVSGSVAPQFGDVTITDPLDDVPSSLTLSGATTINIAGDFSDDGTFTPNQGTVSLNGSADQFLTGASTTNFYGLEINKPGFGVTIQHATRVMDVVRILTATQVTAGSNLLTLVSTAARTARVNPLIAGAAINGSVIVQRFLPTGVSAVRYRYLASPVTNTFVQDWKQEFSITGTFSDPTANNPSPSMYYYDETFTAGGPGLNDRYRNYPSSGTAAAAPLVHGRGYAVYPFVGIPFTFDSRGTLGQQQVVVNVTAQSAGGVDGWNLIGNPYPSPVHWSKITKSGNVDETVYVPDNTNINGGGFMTYINGVGLPANYDGTIDMGQAFWVHANGNGTVTFDETDKIISTDSVIQMFRVAPRADVFRIALSNGTSRDEIAISFHPDATDSFDKTFDALKLRGAAFNLLSLSADNRELAVNTMANMECAKEVPLSITEGVAGEYTFTASGFETFGSDVNFILVDKKTSSVIDLRESNTYSFTITAGDISTLGSRFVLQTDKTRVLTDLAVEGTSICFSDMNSRVTVFNSQPEVEYQAFYGASPASDLLRGNSGILNLPVVTKSLNTGDNTFSIVAKNGCITHELESQPVVIKLQQTATPAVTDALACSSGTVILTASGALPDQTYNWYDRDDSEEPMANTPVGSLEVSGLTGSTSFYAAITNSIGCESERVKLNVKVVIYDSLTIDVNGAVLLSSYASGNQWYFDGSLLPGADSTSLLATRMGTYTVKVDVDGCIVERSIVPEVVDDPSAEVNVNPNPVADKVNINFPINVAGPSTISIISSSGKVIYSEQFDTARKVTINTPDISPGVYIVHIVVGDLVISRRIIKL